MSTKLYLLVTILGLSGPFLVNGQLAIPARPLGHVFNTNSQVTPKVEVAGYLDPTCPDSQAVYPTLLEIGKAYSASDVQFRLYLFNLPYHRNSHTISKAARVLDGYAASKAGNDKLFAWIADIYSHIDEFTTSATAKETDVEVLDRLAILANALTGISSTDFINGVNDDDIDDATRLEWKYGCTRGVYGTPMFTINDAFVDANSWNLADWKSQLDQLLASS